MAHETIIVQKTEHVQKITLNRPEALNALNEKMGEELNAGLKQAFIGVGLVPDSGSSYFLTRRIGPARALELIMTGRTVGAKEAEALGLVHKVVPATELDSTVDQLAQQLSTGPTKALGLSKR